MHETNNKITPQIFGVRIDDCSVSDILKYILDTVKSDQRAIITYVNVFALNLAFDDPEFRTFIKQANLIICDGFGVILAARLLGRRIIHRNTPPDWIDSLCNLCAENNLSIYLLGAKRGVPIRAAQILTTRHLGLKIIGNHHGYFDKHQYSPENQAVIDEINFFKPDILIIGFGMPLQERWIAENLANIQIHIALPVGAMIDYVAGEVYRAPHWMTDHGLEWLGRLVIEPRRLWRRYLLGNPLFLWRVLMQRFGLLRLK